MVKGLINRKVLDRIKPLELTLELLSFSGGENTIGSDHELENNQARIIKNWEAESIGSMIRSKGFTKVGDGGASYSEDMDLVAHHFEGVTTATYGVIEGDLVILSGSDLNQEDAAAFTSGTLCHSVSAGDKLWITNATDNLHQKEIGVAIATPTDQPATASDRIYEHNFRLIAEGNTADTVYGSVVGKGNWSGANGWTTSNNAWSMVMPSRTQGVVPGFPSGNDITVFTEFDTYVVYNQPNVARRRILNGIGSSAPYALARGNEGVFLFSTYPTKGVFLWNGVEFINLTEYHDFIDDVNLAQRIFGIYKDRNYYFIYNESGSGVTYPNRIRKYNTQFGRWMEREINSDLSDSLGYPSLQTKDNNELYLGSSTTDKLYELDDSSTSDGGQNTEATYKTKAFGSRDFNVSSGGSRLPIDGVKIKLLGADVFFDAQQGVITLQWEADRGAKSGSQTFDLTADGDIINDSFTVNTSKVVTTPPTRKVFKTFNNSAVGREFEFDILNSGTGNRPEIKKIKIYALALEE